MKVRLLAVCAVSLAMLVAARPAIGASSRESDCVTVTIHATNSAGPVAPGTTIGLTGQFQNCSSKRVRFAYNLAAMSSCGLRVELASDRKTLDPGMARIWSMSYTMPLDTCSGAWEATMRLSDVNGGSLTSEGGTPASASTTVTVQ